MKTTIIAVLATINVAISCALLYGIYEKPVAKTGDSLEIPVDQLQRLHLNTQDGKLRATFGQQGQPNPVTVAMTPGAAIRLYRDLGTFLDAIDRAAKGGREAPRSSQ